MLRYGIPDYRLPQEILDRDIDHILSAGVRVHTGVSIGRDLTMEDIQKSFDAVYIAIGAHNEQKLGLEGEDSQNVISAVELLRGIGEGQVPDFTGKKVCVIGGGNVSRTPPAPPCAWGRTASPVSTAARVGGHDRPV